MTSKVVVFDVKFGFTFDIFSHLTLFHFISWLLRPALTASSPRLKLTLSARVIINFRLNDEALLAAALTGFTRNSVGLVESREEDKREPDH